MFKCLQYNVYVYTYICICMEYVCLKMTTAMSWTAFSLYCYLHIYGARCPDKYFIYVVQHCLCVYDSFGAIFSGLDDGVISKKETWNEWTTTPYILHTCVHTRGKTKAKLWNLWHEFLLTNFHKLFDKMWAVLLGYHGLCMPIHLYISQLSSTLISEEINFYFHSFSICLSASICRWKCCRCFILHFVCCSSPQHNTLYAHCHTWTLIRMLFLLSI